MSLRRATGEDWSQIRWQDLGFEIFGTVPGAFESRTHRRVGLPVMYRDLRAT